VADRALRFLFAGAPRPRVAPLSRRWAGDPLPPPASASLPGRRGRAALRLYWALALAAAAALLPSPAWPASLPASLGVAAASAVGAVLVPIALLARLRGGAFELACRMLR